MKTGWEHSYGGWQGTGDEFVQVVSWKEKCQTAVGHTGKHVFSLYLQSGWNAFRRSTLLHQSNSGCPTGLCLCHYSMDQGAFLCPIVADLFHCRMAFLYPKASWTCAQLLPSKNALVRFKFTVYLWSLHYFTIKHGLADAKHRTNTSSAGLLGVVRAWSITWLLPVPFVEWK